MQTPIFHHWSDFPSDLWTWPHFRPEEMACKGSGNLMLDGLAMDRLEALREVVGKPIIILSAYRSPAHNATVGGATHSQHMQGRAFDVAMRNHDPVDFMDAARACGFTGIGTYPDQGFVHIDIGPTRAWGQPFPDTDVTLRLAGQVVKAVAEVAVETVLRKVGTRRGGTVVRRLKGG